MVAETCAGADDFIDVVSGTAGAGRSGPGGGRNAGAVTGTR